LKDHASATLSTGLGNVLAVVSPTVTNSLEVLQTNDYFPFGMSMSKNSTTTPYNKYKYNGKEEQEMPGKWLDYGARFYDAQLGRWHSVDPLAEQYVYNTPYSYVGNRPLVFFDPDGRFAQGYATRYVDPYGNTIIDTDDGRDDVVVVPWNRLDEFKENAEASSKTGHSNSIGWNNYWRDEFGIAISESFLNQFHSQAAKDAYVEYSFSGEMSDWTWSLLCEVGGQWTDPELALQGISMGLNGFHFTSMMHFSKSVLKNKKNGLNNIGFQLQSHAGRKGSAFSNIKFSHKTANKVGLEVLNRIAKSNNKKIINQPTGGYAVYDLNTGRGYAVSRTGLFNGFRELPKQ
jgi:RHS repeat-associated protein